MEASVESPDIASRKEHLQVEWIDVANVDRSDLVPAAVREVLGQTPAEQLTFLETTW